MSDGELIEQLRRNSGWRNAQWQCITDPALLVEAADRLQALSAEVEEYRIAEKLRRAARAGRPSERNW